MNTSNEKAYLNGEDLKSFPDSRTTIEWMTLDQIKEKYGTSADLTHLGMTLNAYQKFTDSTKTFPEKHAIVYPALGLAEEAGEVAGKVKKWLRGDTETLDVERTKKEMGDVLWYLASLATDLGITLEDVAQTNIEKLTKRKETGTLKGDGDDREYEQTWNKLSPQEKKILMDYLISFPLKDLPHEMKDFSGVYH